jgi:hypothetical protein
MEKSKPLVDDEGEVRELLIEDIREFRSIAEVASPSLAAKLGIHKRPVRMTDVDAEIGRSRKRSAGSQNGAGPSRSTG